MAVNPLRHDTKDGLASSPDTAIRPVLLVRNALIGFAGLLGLVLLVRLIFIRSYDYDELSHAHMAWLVSIGQVPYRDFATNHFPFFWIPLWPVMRVIPESLGSLMILRGLALLLNIAFIGALGALICLEQPPQQRPLAAACFGVILFSQPVMHFLIEFRPDALANALLFGSLVLLWLQGMRNKLVAFVSGFCIGIALLVNTKYGLFPFMLGAVALMAHAREIRRTWRFALAICLGFIAAVLGGILVLAGMKIPLDRAWEMVVLYNAAVEKIHTFGLAHVLTLHPLLLAYVLVGLAGCIVQWVLQRRPPGVLEVAILLFLIANLATTARPYKQYLASWLLLATCFPARSLPALAAWFGSKAQIAAAVCIVGIAIAVFTHTGIIDPYELPELNRATQDRAIEWALRCVPPDGFVICSFTAHPVFRRDTFFKVVFDQRPNGEDGLEQFMPSLAPGSYSEHFQRSGYDADLKDRSPSLIMEQVLYTKAQNRAVIDYLNQTPNSYDEYVIPDTTIHVLQRRGGNSSGVK
jgi:hypothetical protein